MLGPVAGGFLRLCRRSPATSRFLQRVMADLPSASDEGEGPAAALRYGDGTAVVDNVPESVHTERISGVKDVSGLGAGDSALIPQFLEASEADRFFENLLPGGEIEYQQWYHMPDKKKPHEALKRLQRIKVAMADPEVAGLPWYRFPVNDQQRYGILPMSPTIRELCTRVSQRTGFHFNHAVVLYYADGNECIGFHKDKALDLDDQAPIVSISLGRPGRPYLLRDDIFQPTQQTEIFLGHGALFQLGAKTNSSFYHAVKQTTAASTGPRVSITFRRVLTYKTDLGELTGQGANYPTLNWPTELNGQHRFDDALEETLPGVPTKIPPRATSDAPKREQRGQLQPSDVKFLKECLEEANLEEFFEKGDLRGAGLAARELLKTKGRSELSKALGQRIGEAFHAWQATKRAPPDLKEKPVPTAKQPVDTVAPATSVATSCWLFGGKLARWFCESTPRVTPQDILQYWFGDEPYKFRGGLWWRGIDPAMPLDGQEGTDRRIRERYGELIRSCARGLPTHLHSWTQSPEGCCALVLLLDQFPRNAFRGTAEMFQYDSLAQEMAKEALKGDLPWPHATFCYVAFMHSENVEMVEESCLGLLRVAASVDASIGSRLKPMQVEARHHATVLGKFGRYPHRNEVLGRGSTVEEQKWLHSKKLPAWAMSVRPKFNRPERTEAMPALPGVTDATASRKIRVLVLHSNRQNAQDFKRRTRSVLHPLTEVADLHFVEAPHAYTPMGEAEEQSAILGAAEKNRCWWNSTDDPSTMRYVGFEKTLEHIEKTFIEAGPFDGIVGFSQGGCLAGLLAAMQPRGAIRFNFCVLISGFYCRDVEFCKLQLEGVPERHQQDMVKAKQGAVALPSFHIWGLDDQLVEPWRSEILSETFKDPMIVTHPADHFSKGRHHWPIAQLVDWLLKSGLAVECPVDAADPVEVSPWAKIMKGSGVANVSFEDVKEAVEEVDGQKKTVRQLLDRSLSLIPWNSKVAQPSAAYWIFIMVASDPSLQSHNDLLKELINAGGWRTPVHLYGIIEEMNDSKQVKLQESIILYIAKQIHEDRQVAEDWRANDDHQGMSPALSECARFAPRFGGAVRRFALRVAAEVHKLAGGSVSDDLRQQQPELSTMHRKVLSDIIAVLDENTEGHLANLKGERRHQWRMGGMDIKRFEALKDSPLTDAVLHPEPEPVEISAKDQLDPLYSFLQSGNAFQPNINDDLVFTKGTITRDKRLDLCKQVIGPAGVDDLLQSICTNQTAGLVEHLLLGNNVCGNDLPRRIAELIKDDKVALRTWYIAGNRITGEGLAPLCEVLRDDQFVHQLWLKRNPLHADGAGLLSRMLQTNRTIKVLDLVNCGLLDAGAEALLPGLQESGVEHLYLDGNGLTSKSAKAITLAGRNLRTLSLGMNRLFDEGVQFVCSNLSPSVTRLCLASCGMSVPGAEAVAKMLRSNRTLRYLDLGLLKATSALGEVPNRITDEGAVVLAAALEENSTLNGLVLVHNTIHQAGLKAIQTSISKNTSMVKLELEQLGIAYNELTREEIRHTLNKNRRKFQENPEEWNKIQEALDPAHLEEIKSVYRMGNTYSPHGEPEMVD